MKSKSLLFFTILILFSQTSCVKDCNCSESLHTKFTEELCRKVEFTTDKQIVCRQIDNFWLFKNEGYLDWNYLYIPYSGGREGFATINKLTKSDVELVKNFVSELVIKNFEFDLLRKDDDSLFTFRMEQSNGETALKQSYYFHSDKKWEKKQDFLVNYYGKIEKFDFSNIKK